MSSKLCVQTPTLIEELLPVPDPVDVLRRFADRPGLLFLDSALTHPGLGRYSFLAADPFDYLWSRGKLVHGAGGRYDDMDPFAALAAHLRQFPSEHDPRLPPFQGGAAGVLGYDLCHHLERLPWPRYNDLPTPDLAVGFYDWVIAWDHQDNRAWLISTGFPKLTRNSRLRRAAFRLNEVRRKLRASPPSPPSPTGSVLLPLAPQWPVPHFPGLTSNFDRETYLATIRRAIEYIHAGDCFQVNVAQRLLYPYLAPPLDLYLRLRERNPATFAGYFSLGDYQIVSASPERFLRVHGGEVETRPIKGTRPRGATPQEDDARIEELLRSEKDRAENIMIVDLLRNDLGRVCRYGSVKVEAVCRVETYPFVHHLVSEVRGRLREGLGPVDLLRAAFPGGSVTGAPKIRAMEIIAELEPTARGPYCGSLGYIGFDGTMDTNILIRTFTAGHGWIQFPVGGGIVADSVPEHEYEETWHKAAGLLRALA
jgi:para-aminobenzoate synthetase component 1